MKRRDWIIVSLVVVGAIAIFNAFVTVPVASARAGERGVTMVAYHRWLVDPSTVVIDLWSIDGTVSMADVDRNLFEAAEALKARSFSKVVLAYKGNGRFLLDGTQFKTIGEERSFQNPMYTVRTLTEHITNTDGTRAFETWEGGLLGVLTAQMKDHSQLHWRWYLASMSGADPDSQMPTEPVS